MPCFMTVEPLNLAYFKMLCFKANLTHHVIRIYYSCFFLLLFSNFNTFLFLYSSFAIFVHNKV